MKMKVFLACLLVCVLVTSVAQGEMVEHLLWDIPYGISMEECIKQVLEKTGILLEKKSIGLGMSLYSKKEQEINFLGHSAELEAVFVNGGENLCEFSFSFKPLVNKKYSTFEDDEETDAMIEALTEYYAVLDGLETKYEKASGGRVSVKLDGVDEEYDTMTYNYPLTENEKLDVDKALQIFKNSNRVEIHTYFHNITTTLSLYALEEMDSLVITLEIYFARGVEEGGPLSSIYTSFDGNYGDYSVMESSIEIGL